MIRVMLIPELLEGAQILRAQVLHTGTSVVEMHHIIRAIPLETDRSQRRLPSSVIVDVDGGATFVIRRA